MTAQPQKKYAFVKESDGFTVLKNGQPHAAVVAPPKELKEVYPNVVALQFFKRVSASEVLDALMEHIIKSDPTPTKK